MFIALSAAGPREQQSHRLDIETAQIQSLFQRFLEQIHTHIDDPTEVHRSMARFQLLSYSLLQSLPETIETAWPGPLCPHCSSGVEPRKAPGFLVSASR